MRQFIARVYGLWHPIPQLKVYIPTPMIRYGYAPRELGCIIEHERLLYCHSEWGVLKHEFTYYANIGYSCKQDYEGYIPHDMLPTFRWG